MGDFAGKLAPILPPKGLLGVAISAFTAKLTVLSRD